MSADVDARFADRVRQRLVESGGAPTAARVAATVQAEPGGAVLGQATFARLVGRITDELAGAGPLAPLLADEEVSDVLVNGAEVWVDRGRGLERAEVDVGRPDDVRRLAQRLAATAGRRLDDGCPCADVPLPDGTRLHAVLPPVAVAGPYLSLRAFRRRVFTVDELVATGSVPADGAGLLSAIVAGRIAFLITGGTGTGKTTLLSALLSLVPYSERMVLVEDAAELRPAHPHVVTLQARTSNVEGAGAVTLRDLVRQALRMRPDRLVVGECRGPEVVDLLGALNTGHEGGAATLHANTPADVPARLEALGLLGGVPRTALHAQVAAALQVVVHLRRNRGQRVVDEVCVLLPDGPDRLVRAVPAWRRGRGFGPGSEALRALLVQRGAAR
jgi:pilus assembly protein CpaF